MMDKHHEAKERLAALLGRIFEDGQVDDSERAELQGFYRNALLSVTDVKDVFARYLHALQADVLADGTVTEAERTKIRTAVATLKMPPSLLPPELAEILASGQR